MRMKKRNAIAVAFLLTVGAFLLVSTLVERPFLDTRVPPGRENRAAIAIRDKVPPFQQWGTRTFTRRYLHRYYDASWYFTQAQKGDQKSAFIARLDEALSNYERVDLFLLSHTNHYVEWAAQLPAEKRAHLHLVYNTGCHNLPQGTEWLDLGADTYVGHPGVSMSSIFYVYFLRRWTRGENVTQAMNTSNQNAWWTFRLWEAVPFWDFNAEEVFAESEAALFGEGALDIGAAP